uniref:Ig-like domain-containing protein n=1 Tax=Amphiprion ocellaris TaxID=80972 RepID=A0A3Q1CCK1_AMPOC
MFLEAAACVVLGFILNISGVQGKQRSICALKSSSVNLTCSAEHPTSDLEWYSGFWDHSRIEVSADGNRSKYSISEENNFTLTINNLTDTDADIYCCGKPTDKSVNCQINQTILLHVADLQVKVIPSTEGQTVTLMCSTSCPLTEKPAAYIWYKNGEFLYEDWSPWYQELLSSDQAVRYSCAVKGYEDLRAPEVSVGIHVQMTPGKKDHFRLTCNTGCSLTSFTWYKDRKTDRQKEKQQILVPSSITGNPSFSCAVTGFEDLRSADVCVDDNNCWSLNCVNRRICALEGSSVNISHEYSHPEDEEPKSTLWYKAEGNAEHKEWHGHNVEYEETKKQNILRLEKLKKSDSAEYRFIIETTNNELKHCGFRGISLIVTGLTVTMSPSAEVTEGQRVTLTCSTSCPLTDNNNYIWYLNSRPLSQNKHLVLDPVGLQHAGNYSCAVKTHGDMESAVKTLTVRSISTNWKVAAMGVGAALMVLILLTVILWIGFCRKKKTSSKSPNEETLDKLEQYSEISAQPAEEKHYYSRVQFSKNHTDPLYSTIQPHQPQEQEHTPYAVVRIRSNTTEAL